MNQRIVFDTLHLMAIPYKMVEHEPAYTIEDIDRIDLSSYGEVPKNLFLRDEKGKRHFLVVVQKDKTVDLKSLRERLGTTRLSFGSPERLLKYLKLTKGSVTPFGVLNDENSEVEVVFDNTLCDKTSLGFHPNDNSATVFLSFGDIKKVVETHGNKIAYVSI